MSKMLTLFIMNKQTKNVTNHLRHRQRERFLMAKKGEQKNYEATTGVKYILQHPGLREAIRMRDRSKTERGTSTEALYSEFMEHVIFEDVEGTPQRVTWDHFEEKGGLSEVMKQASTFVFQNI